jgi:hypothetical protein
LTDADVVRLAQQGDADALERIYPFRSRKVAVCIFVPLRWSRLLWTYLIPVIPFVLFFDGLISCLRAYSLGELQEMTSGLEGGGYRWEIGEKTGGLLPVRITYLIGCPQRVSVGSGD